jgi:hypothetical protein
VKHQTKLSPDPIGSFPAIVHLNIKKGFAMKQTLLKLVAQGGFEPPPPKGADFESAKSTSSITAPQTLCARFIGDINDDCKEDFSIKKLNS